MTEKASPRQHQFPEFCPILAVGFSSELLLWPRSDTLLPVPVPWLCALAQSSLCVLVVDCVSYSYPPWIWNNIFLCFRITEVKFFDTHEWSVTELSSEACHEYRKNAHIQASISLASAISYCQLTGRGLLSLSRNK